MAEITGMSRTDNQYLPVLVNARLKPAMLFLG